MVVSSSLKRPAAYNVGMKRPASAISDGKIDESKDVVHSWGKSWMRSKLQPSWSRKHLEKTIKGGKLNWHTAVRSVLGASMASLDFLQLNYVH